MSQLRRNNMKSTNCGPKTPQEKARACERVSEIFGGKFEADVIKLIMEECDWEESEAIEKLFQLSSDEVSSKAQSECLGLDIIACNLLESDYESGNPSGDSANSRPVSTETSNLEDQPEEAGSMKPNKGDTSDTTHKCEGLPQGSTTPSHPAPFVDCPLVDADLSLSFGNQFIGSGQWDSTDCDIGKDSGNTFLPADFIPKGNSVTDNKFSSALPQQFLSLNDKNLVMKPSGLESLVKCKLSPSQADYMPGQSGKLADMTLAGTCVAAVPEQVVIDSTSVLCSGSFETRTVESQSGEKNTPSGQFSSKGLSADAAEFNPRSRTLPAQSSASSALGFIPQFFVPKYPDYSTPIQPTWVKTTGGIIGPNQSPSFLHEHSLNQMHGTRPFFQTSSMSRSSFQPNTGNVGINRFTGQSAHQSTYQTPQSASGAGIWPGSGASFSAKVATAKQTPLTAAAQNPAATAKQSSTQAAAKSAAHTLQSGSSSSIVTKAEKQMVERIKRYGWAKVLIILRGLPGSGKSCLARKLKGSGQIFSTDEYFVNGEVYNFCHEKLPEAHAWNRKRVQKALEDGVTPVIVDNTNTEVWEMLPYAKMAISRGYTLEILEPDTPWRFQPKRLAKTNVHNVQLETIKKMKERYESIDTAGLVRLAKGKLMDKTQQQGADTDKRKDSVSPAKQMKKQAAPEGGQSGAHHQPLCSSAGKPKPGAGKFAKKPKKDLIGIRDHFLKLQKGGAKEEEIDALLYVANLTRNEVNEIKEHLKQFRNNFDDDRTKKSLKKTNFSSGSKECVNDSKPTSKSNAGSASKTSWSSDQGVAQRAKLDNAGVRHGASYEPAPSSTDSHLWTAPQPRRAEKHAHSASERQRMTVDGIGGASEEKTASPDPTTTWDCSLPQRDQAGRAVRSFKAREREERGSQSSNDSTSQTEMSHDVESSSEVLSCWESSSKADFLDNGGEPASMSTISGTWESLNLSEQLDSWEVPCKAELASSAAVLKEEDVDSISGVGGESTNVMQERTEDLHSSEETKVTSTCRRETDSGQEFETVAQTDKGSVSDNSYIGDSNLASESDSVETREVKITELESIDEGDLKKQHLADLDTESSVEPKWDTTEAGTTEENSVTDTSRGSIVVPGSEGSETGQPSSKTDKDSSLECKSADSDVWEDAEEELKNLSTDSIVIIPLTEKSVDWSEEKDQPQHIGPEKADCESVQSSRDLDPEPPKYSERRKSLKSEENEALNPPVLAVQNADVVSRVVEGREESEPVTPADLQQDTAPTVTMDEGKSGELSESSALKEASESVQHTGSGEEQARSTHLQEESGLLEGAVPLKSFLQRHVPLVDYSSSDGSCVEEENFVIPETSKSSTSDQVVASTVDLTSSQESKSDSRTPADSVMNKRFSDSDPGFEPLFSCDKSKSVSPVQQAGNWESKPKPLPLTIIERGRSASPTMSSQLSDSSNPASPRKVRKKKHKRQPGPFFEDDVKVLLTSESWKNFEPEKQIVGKESSKDQPALERQLSNTDRKETQFSTNFQGERNCNQATTQTEGKDFGAVLKGTSPEKEYVIIVPNSYYKCSENTDVFPRRDQKRSCDKSTMVDMSEEPSVDQMHTLFPDVAEAHLNEVLEVCHGDVDMAIDLMFEWGITNPITPHDKHLLSKKTLGHKIMETAHGCTESEENSPPRLMDMCMKVVPTVEANMQIVQQKLISSSEQHLHTIENSEFKRLRSMNSENSNDSPAGLNLPPDISLSAFNPDDIRSVTHGHLWHSLRDWKSDTSSEPSEIGSLSELQSSVAEFNDGEAGYSDKGAYELADPDSFQTLPKVIAAEPYPGPTAKPEEPRSQLVPEGDLTLTLPASLINNLEQLFGRLPIADQKSASSRTVQLDHTTAHNLYQCLSQSVRAQQVVTEEERLRQLREDEALAQWLQGEEEVDHTLHSIATSESENPSLLTTLPPTPYPRERKGGPARTSGVSRRSPKPVNLKDIMDEEMEKQRSLEKQTKLLEARGDHIAIATVLKREKLQQHFPGVDERVLEEIFLANGYCLETTVRVISSALGGKQPVSHKLEMSSADSRAAEEETYYTTEAVKQISLQDVRMNQGDREQFQRVDAFLQPDQDYQEMRQEALLHHYMRKECFQKAHNAHCRGMPDVADFYSKEGRAHFEKMKEANVRASERLLETRHEKLAQEMTLDLHGFHVEEAIAVLKRVVEEKEKEFHQKPVHNRRHLYVITGRGKHSQRGVSRLRPAMIAHLESTGYKYLEAKPGLLKIYLRTPS